MRKLLNTLYICSDDLYMSLENDNVIVQRNKEETNRFPLHTLESVVSFSRKGMSVPLISACAMRGIPIFLMSWNGSLLAEISVPSRGNVLLRREQHRIADDPAKAAGIAASMLTGKIRNQKHMIDRFLWEHGQVPAMRSCSAALEGIAAGIRSAENAAALRGLEGEASAVYYSCFNAFIAEGRSAFRFHGRSRRPPMDRVNALLSFGYTLLHNECAAALESVGLDAYVGFLHDDRPGRKSLACNLMEEFRSSVVDRFVLSLINLGIIRPDLFDFPEGSGVYLNREGRKVFIRHWQLNRKETLTHPVLNESIPLGLLPYAQASLLAKAVRGEDPEYLPFCRR